MQTNYISSAIPKTLLSIGVKALEEDARLQSPSESDDTRFSSRNEYLTIQVIGTTKTSPKNLRNSKAFSKKCYCCYFQAMNVIGLYMITPENMKSNDSYFT